MHTCNLYNTLMRYNAVIIRQLLLLFSFLCLMTTETDVVETVFQAFTSDLAVFFLFIFIYNSNVASHIIPL